ncbi:hypothetical protein BLNAU_9775 [Blattamonas nauphoetae]|uniref:Uncharacterized protein n=1 Tax=Blattamonas nauphoetae TaxID=2049346 RepID=A0ABQ9XUR4_9EUKA|nr:hypothetical protein BLNAU_9775 [Blattamonas nauphoetae]
MPSKTRLSLVTADLIPQLITSLDPLSLSFIEGKDIHLPLMGIFASMFKLAIPAELKDLDLDSPLGQQNINEIVLKHVLIPSEGFIRYFYANRYSIEDNINTYNILFMHYRLIKICANYQPIVDFVLALPVSLTFTSLMSFLEKDTTICQFLEGIVDAQKATIDIDDPSRQPYTSILRSLRMDGLEDVVNQLTVTLLDDYYGRIAVGRSIKLHIASGANLPERRLH